MFLLIGGEQEEAPKNIREACEPLLLQATRRQGMPGCKFVASALKIC